MLDCGFLFLGINVQVVNCFWKIVWANPLIWADSDCAGWTVHDDWKIALVMVLVEVERVKMAVVCPSVDMQAHWE